MDAPELSSVCDEEAGIAAGGSDAVTPTEPPEEVQEDAARAEASMTAHVAAMAARCERPERELITMRAFILETTSASRGSLSDIPAPHVPHSHVAAGRALQLAT